MELPKSPNNPSAGQRDHKKIKGPGAFLLKITLMILSPLLFLVTAEGILRVIGFGRDTGFFVEWKTEKETVYLVNTGFPLQFVPPELSRDPNEIILKPERDPACRRIFVLGGSAAAGDPDPAFGFSRVLELILNELSDGLSFEVVNAAVTSMNSHVVRHIAGDCAGHRPDAFVVYMGNNEVVGPYGPSSLPSSLYASTRFIRGMIFLKGTRTGQLVSSLMQPKNGGTGKWQGMEAFLAYQLPFEDKKLEYCYEHFRANLADIVRIAEEARAKTVLCTVPTNIRSCAPFGAMHGRELSSEQLDRWQVLFEQGRALQKAGDFAGALAEYRRAADLDPLHADLVYALGKCYEALGDIENARESYIRARDLDTLRFRADSRIDGVIRKVAAENAGSSLLLADLDKMLSAHSANQLLGEDLFVDHVHLNFRANVLAALAVMHAFDDLFDDVTFDNRGEAFERIHDLCRERLLYDIHAEYELAMKMYLRKTRPPFAGQQDHESEMASLRRKLNDLRAQARLSGSGAALTEYLHAADKAPDDSILNLRLGELWLKHGESGKAIRRYENMLARSPYNVTLRAALSEALAKVGRVDDAINLLISPENPQKWDRDKSLLFVGGALIRNNHVQQAVELYEEVISRNPENVEALVNLGIAAKKYSPEEAGDYFHRALKSDPGCVDAMINLGNICVEQKKTAEALAWYRKALEANPYHHLAHFGLGLELLKQGDLSGSLEHIERSVHLYPEFVQGYQVLHYIFQQQGKDKLADAYRDLAILYQD